MNAEDWRLNGQEQHLRRARFQRRAYRAPSATWDHDHCEFCYRKLAENAPGDDVARAGWQSEDEHRWICEECFADFREPFGFVVFAGESQRGIELHDARVVAMTEDGGVLTIDLDAFVHDERESDSGDGQWLRVSLDFHEAASDVRGSVGAELSDGTVRVDERVHENVLPVPFRETGSVLATLVGGAFEVEVRARYVRMRLGAPID